MIPSASGHPLNARPDPRTYECPVEGVLDTRPPSESNTLRELADALRTRAERAEAEADRLIAALNDERDRSMAERTRADTLTAAMERAEQARQQADAALSAAEAALTTERGRAASAEAEVARLAEAIKQAEAGGRLARLMRAWRGV
jgi:hypothetical protein